MNPYCKSHPEAPKTKSGDFLQIHLSSSYGGNRQPPRTRSYKPGREDHPCSRLCDGPTSKDGHAQEKQRTSPPTYRRQDLLLHGQSNFSRQHPASKTSGFRSPEAHLSPRQKQGILDFDTWARLLWATSGLLQLRELSKENGFI